MKVADPTTAASSGSGLRGQVAQTIKNVADRTGSDFGYLLQKAAIESGLDPNAKAKNSSATGLFQFTGQTWLRTVKASGEEYGLGDYADHIQVGSNGVAHVNDPVWRDAILSLRQDPEISAEMSCELDKANLQKLRQTVGGDIGPTELYLAHFLGAGGASTFLNTMRANPNAKAAEILPGAARANSSIFYGADGHSRSTAEIYNHFAQKLNTAPTDAVALASQSGAPKISAPASLSPASGPATLSAASTVLPSHIQDRTAAAASLLQAAAILQQMDLSALESAFAPDDDSETENSLSSLA